MAFRFTTTTLEVSSVATTASTNVLAGPIDISSYEKVALFVHNLQSAVDLHFLQLQVSHFTASNVGTTAAPNWYTLATADVGLPSSIAASAGDMTTPIANCYRFMRLIGGVSQTGGTSVTVGVTIGGFTRD